MEIINFTNQAHFDAFFQLLNNYMEDDMGGNKSLEISSCIKIVSDLQRQSNYIGFLMKENNIYVGLANCFINYSTFKAKPLLNIHDFVVRTENRGKGVATRFMGQIKQYAVEMGYCRINLEVRTDNEAAKQVYQKAGFGPCKPDMLFWELNL